MNFLRLTLLLYLSISICADGWAEEKKNTKEKTTEQQLAEFLEKAAIAETELRMATLQTRIDEMKDLCALEPEQSSKLTLAAKGAVEGSLDNWRQWIQSYATSQIERHKGKNLEAAFAQIAQVRYGGNETLLILKSDLWTNALKENLTDHQRKIIAEAEKSRLDFRHQAITDYLMANLDFRLRFSTGQRDQLRPLILATTEKYTTKLIQQCGGEFPIYQTISLLGGVEEDTAKDILTETQWTSWEALFREHGSWWDAINR